MHCIRYSFAGHGSSDPPYFQKKSIDVADLPRYNLVNYQNFDFSDWLQILGLENDNRVLYVFDRGGLFDSVRESGYFRSSSRVTQTIPHKTAVYSFRWWGWRKNWKFFFCKRTLIKWTSGNIGLFSRSFIAWKIFQPRNLLKLDLFALIHPYIFY